MLLEKHLVSLWKFPHHFQPYLIVSPGQLEDFAKRLLSIVWNLGEHLLVQHSFLPQTRCVVDKLAAKHVPFRGRSLVIVLQKGLEDGNEVHFIQLEQQAELKRSGN